MSNLTLKCGNDGAPIALLSVDFLATGNFPENICIPEQDEKEI